MRFVARTKHGTKVTFDPELDERVKSVHPGASSDEGFVKLRRGESVHDFARECESHGLRCLAVQARRGVIVYDER